jgi:hypothetical protein
LSSFRIFTSSLAPCRSHGSAGDYGSDSATRYALGDYAEVDYMAALER